MVARRKSAIDDCRPIHVAELDEGGHLKLTSVIDAVNVARKLGSVILDLQSRPQPGDNGRREIGTVIEAVRSIVSIHGLAIDVSDPSGIESTDSEKVWIAKAVISRC